MTSSPRDIVSLLEHTKVMWVAETENAERLAVRKRQLVTLTTTLAGLLVAGLYKVSWDQVFPGIFRGIPLFVMLKLVLTSVLFFLAGMGFWRYWRALQCILIPAAKLEAQRRPGDGADEEVGEQELATASGRLTLPEVTVEAAFEPVDQADEVEVEIFRAQYVAAIDLQARNIQAKRVAFWMQKEITEGISATIWATVVYIALVGSMGFTDDPSMGGIDVECRHETGQ